MITGLLLLFVLQSDTRRIGFGLEVENHQLVLAQRPRLNSTVTAYYQIVPRIAKNNVEIVFYNFQGVRPVGSNTVFHFDAKAGVPVKFPINVEYFSTPATFSVGISATHYRLSITRYLLNAATGEYGSLKEIQYKPPIEYRFDPDRRKFEEEVLKFGKNRWQKNRAIIDTIQSIDADIKDSLCLLLYSDVHRIVYPLAITKFTDKARYLLEKGWADYHDEVDRIQFLERLKLANYSENEKKRRELDNELKAAQRVEFQEWLLSWLIPTAALSVLLAVLLVLRVKIPSRVVTSKRLDVVVRYAVYVLAVGIAIYFAWPYLSISELRLGQLPGAQLVRGREVFYKIRKSSVLRNFGDLDVLSKSTFMTESGLGANFVFRDKKHSTFGIEYRFVACVWPTSEGYRLRQPILLPEETIEKFEKNEEVAAYLMAMRVKRAEIVFNDLHFSIIVRDTIIRQDTKLPLSLDYDGERDMITMCTFPPDFENGKFPEIAMLSRLLTRWGCTIKRGTYVTRLENDSKGRAHLVVLIDAGENDTLHIYMQRDSYFRYWWSPVPNVIATPQAILEQIFAGFSNAGLSSEYVRDNIELVSSRSFRRPDYFTYDQRDRAIVNATFKWVTNCNWVDTFNYGEGVRFTVVHEYFTQSMKLGRALGRPETSGIHELWQAITPRYYSMRPLGRVISRQAARAKIFDALPDESWFNNLYIRLIIPEKSDRLDRMLCLVGEYGSYEIMVDLESGVTIGPQASRRWRWTDLRQPEIHSYPYDDNKN